MLPASDSRKGDRPLQSFSDKTKSQGRKKPRFPPNGKTNNREKLVG